MTDTFTVPGLDEELARRTRDRLQERLVALIDTSLTLKHIHWNVVGPTFIGVHEMLDPQYKGVANMVDQIAERIATLGGSPNGLAGYLVTHRSWDDYAVSRAVVSEHLSALDDVYSGVIGDHRHAIEDFESTDPVTQDMLIGHTEKLEQYQWFVRAHLEDGSGHVHHKNDETNGTGKSDADSSNKTMKSAKGNGSKTQ